MFTVVALMMVSSLLAPAGAASGEATRPRVLYVSNLGSDTEAASIAMFTVDRQNGTPTPLARPLPAGAGPRAVVATPDGRFVYVADTDAGRVLIYSVGRSGALTELGDVRADGDPFGLAMAPSGRTLYAALQGTDQVTAFSVAPTRAASRCRLTAVSCTSPTACATRPRPARSPSSR
jgi:6-phosphogluconolactonase (cycloisomerase 2 family)